MVVATVSGEILHRLILYSLMDDLILGYNQLAALVASKQGLRVTRRTVRDHSLKPGWAVVTWYAE